MTLTELYASMPAEKHKNIIVQGSICYVRGDDDLTDQHAIDREGNLNLIASERRILTRLIASIPAQVDMSTRVKAIKDKIDTL